MPRLLIEVVTNHVFVDSAPSSPPFNYFSKDKTPRSSWGKAIMILFLIWCGAAIFVVWLRHLVNGELLYDMQGFLQRFLIVLAPLWVNVLLSLYALYFLNSLFSSRF